MNAGAYGGEMAQVVEAVSSLDVESGVKTLSRREMEFGYRRKDFDRPPGLGGFKRGVLPDARRPGGDSGEYGDADGKAEGQTAFGMAQRGQYL